MNRKVEPRRPPGQYILAEGTRYCLQPNEYDRNTYAQCGYIGNRTLIRCRQIRPKDDLAKNNGICEEHDEFRKGIKRNYEKEMARMKAECDSQFKKRRYSPSIFTDEFVCDEDDWLQPACGFSVEFPEQIYENAVEDDPLRLAGVYTDKEVIKMRIALLKKDIHDISLFRTLLKARALKQYDVFVSSKPKLTSADYNQQRVFEALTAYGKGDRIRAGTTQPRIRDICRYGHVNESNDDDVVANVVESIKCVVEGSTRPRPCAAYSLPKSKFCLQHVTKDPRQMLFTYCSICGAIAMNTDQPLCVFHQMQFVRNRSIDPLHNVRETLDADGKPVKEAAKRTFVPALTIPKRVVIDESDDDVQQHDRISALLKHAEMGSPLAPMLPSPRRLPIGPMGLHSLQQTTSTARAQIAYQHQVHQKQRENALLEERMREREQSLSVSTPPVRRVLSTRELESCRCARERPFHPDFFGERRRSSMSLAKRVLTHYSHQQHAQQHAQKTLQGQQPSQMMRGPPRIISNPLAPPSTAAHVIRSGTLPPGQRPPQSTSLPRPTAPLLPPAAGEQNPQKYFLKQGEANPSATREASEAPPPTGEDDLVEDRKTPPPSNDNSASAVDWRQKGARQPSRQSYTASATPGSAAARTGQSAPGGRRFYQTHQQKMYTSTPRLEDSAVKDEPTTESEGRVPGSDTTATTTDGTSASGVDKSKKADPGTTTSTATKPLPVPPHRLQPKPIVPPVNRGLRPSPFQIDKTPVNKEKDEKDKKKGKSNVDGDETAKEDVKTPADGKKKRPVVSTSTDGDETTPSSSSSSQQRKLRGRASDASGTQRTPKTPSKAAASSAGKTAETPHRQPRAAAVAANFAINTKKDKTATPSTSFTKRDLPSETAGMSPLRVLAVVSAEIAAQEERKSEERERRRKSRTPGPASGKRPSQSSSSSSSKKSRPSADTTDEHEEEL